MKLVAFLQNDADLRCLGLQLLQDGARAISAEIVDNDDLFWNGDGTDAADQLTNPALLVVAGDDDGELEARRDGVEADLAAGGIAEQGAQQFGALRLIEFGDLAA